MAKRTHHLVPDVCVIYVTLVVAVRYNAQTKASVTIVCVIVRLDTKARYVKLWIVQVNQTAVGMASAQGTRTDLYVFVIMASLETTAPSLFVQEHQLAQEMVCVNCQPIAVCQPVPVTMATRVLTVRLVSLASQDQGVTAVSQITLDTIQLAAFSVFMDMPLNQVETYVGATLMISMDTGQEQAVMSV